MENISEQFTGEHSGDGGAHHILNRSKKAMSDAYSKTAMMASEGYTQAKQFSYTNPGKAMLIALGVGVGLGIAISAVTGGVRESRIDKIGRPLVDALADVGRAFFS